MDVSVFTSGSCGNCTFISSGDTNILIDLGLSKRYLVNALREFGLLLKDINAVLLTHEHVDHVRGLSSICNFTDMEVFSTEGTWKNLRLPNNYCAYESSFNVDRLKHFKPGSSFHVGNLTVETFSISHDACDPVGYRITDEDGSSVALATDTGIVTSDIAKGIKGADVIILESNYDEEMLTCGRYPVFLKRRIMGKEGHLSNVACGRNLLDAIKYNTKHVYLAHLSEENNNPAVAEETVSSILRNGGLRVNEDVNLLLTKRYEVAEPVRIGKPGKSCSVLPNGRLFR